MFIDQSTYIVTSPLLHLKVKVVVALVYAIFILVSHFIHCGGPYVENKQANSGNNNSFQSTAVLAKIFVKLNSVECHTLPRRQDVNMILLLLIVIVVVMIAMGVGLYQKNTNIICKSKKRLDGKIAVVTGGTSGMGLRIAIDFADRGARVIVACPFVDEGTEGRTIIVDKTGNEEVVFKLLDLSSCSSIRKFVADLNRNEGRLDILVNNAGIGAVEDVLTKDGMNYTMQVNYYGQFLLTLLLLPLMRKTGTASEPARIVNTSSVLHNFGSTNFDMMNAINYWYPVQIYANSKLCLILFTRELSKRIKDSKVIVNAVDPGAVGTTIFQGFGKYWGAFLTFLFTTLFKTPWQGAQTAIHVALDRKSGEVSGELFKNCKVARAKQSAYSEVLGNRLWEQSQELLSMSSEEMELCLNS